MALTPEQISIIGELLASSDMGLASALMHQKDSGISLASNQASGMPEVKPEAKPEVNPEAKPEIISQPEVKPDSNQNISGLASGLASGLTHDGQKLEVQKLETNQTNSILPETKTIIKNVDLSKAASLIQKRFRKTRRHRAATPMVHVTHKRVTAITHRKRKV